MPKPSIAVVGAGLIGQKHVALVAEHAVLAAIIDPTDAARTLAEQHRAPWHADLGAYLQSERPDGIIIATPNQMHMDHGLRAIAANIPVLIEKPITDNTEAGKTLVEAAKQANVPILVGHHRRHNPKIAAAKAAIDQGLLGDIIAVQAQFWLYKPDEYFDVAWRTRTGAGPVFINLIHDIDLLRHLCGEITSVQATESSRTRNNTVEDTAAILLEFANGALGTVSVSDTIPAPWSWELTAAENPAYPTTDASCYTIGGTKASLSLPDLRLWQHADKRSWWEPISATSLSVQNQDPLIRQLGHFCDVIEGRTTPLVSGSEALATLKVIEAIKQAANSGEKICL
ncbi:MAG: Gfo/Idh/MocA family protein [Paracoccaceae bacterium]